MKAPIPWLLMILTIPLSACQSTKVPDAYGIYANTDGGQIQLKGQQIQLKGNLLSFVSGLTGPSGIECGSLDSFIVFLKGADPSNIRVTRLDFTPTANVRELFGQQNVAVQLWMPKEDIELDISPIQKHDDMYVIKPKRALGKGFYALYFGRFAADIPTERPVVYDIVVGSAKDFPSHEAKVSSLQTETKDTAVSLVKRMNQMFNASDYNHLDEVYRPQGQALIGGKLDEFIAGSHTWRTNAGTILKSEIAEWTVSPNGESAHGALETTYEKSGVQREGITITKISGSYYITAIQ